MSIRFGLTVNECKTYQFHTGEPYTDSVIRMKLDNPDELSKIQEVRYKESNRHPFGTPEWARVITDMVELHISADGQDATFGTQYNTPPIDTQGRMDEMVGLIKKARISVVDRTVFLTGLFNMAQQHKLQIDYTPLTGTKPVLGKEEQTDLDTLASIEEIASNIPSDVEEPISDTSSEGEQTTLPTPEIAGTSFCTPREVGQLLVVNAHVEREQALSNTPTENAVPSTYTPVKSSKAFQRQIKSIFLKFRLFQKFFNAA